MHPFSLTSEEIEQVSGGLAGVIHWLPSPGGGRFPSFSSLLAEVGNFPPMTTLALGEEGGGPSGPPTMTTMAVGEEGGAPPVLSTAGN